LFELNVIILQYKMFIALYVFPASAIRYIHVFLQHVSFDQIHISQMYISHLTTSVCVKAAHLTLEQ